MNKKHTKLVKEVLTNLMLKLENNKYYTIENLSLELNSSYSIIHRAFMILNKQLGWSITPYNTTPYWRDNLRSNIDNPRSNRGRKKGDVYHHDNFEPDWCRTLYKVRRPES